MTIEITENQRVITPDADMWLYNEKAKVISDKVYLGIQTDEAEWSEITDECKQELEAMLYEDVTPDDMATDEDYLSALKEFGVTL